MVRKGGRWRFEQPLPADAKQAAIETRRREEGRAIAAEEWQAGVDRFWSSAIASVNEAGAAVTSLPMKIAPRVFTALTDEGRDRAIAKHEKREEAKKAKAKAAKDRDQKKPTSTTTTSSPTSPPPPAKLPYPSPTRLLRENVAKTYAASSDVVKKYAAVVDASPPPFLGRVSAATGLAPSAVAAAALGAFCLTLVPIRPRRRGERRFLRTLLPVVSLRPGSLAFNPDTPRRLSTPLLTPFNSTPTFAFKALAAGVSLAGVVGGGGTRGERSEGNDRRRSTRGIANTDAVDAAGAASGETRREESSLSEELEADREAQRRRWRNAVGDDEESDSSTSAPRGGVQLNDVDGAVDDASSSSDESSDDADVADADVEDARRLGEDIVREMTTASSTATAAAAAADADDDDDDSNYSNDTEADAKRRRDAKLRAEASVMSEYASADSPTSPGGTGWDERELREMKKKFRDFLRDTKAK
jgi:hypothetical protein